MFLTQFLIYLIIIRIIKVRTIHTYIILLYFDIINLDKHISDLFYYIKLDVLYIVGCGDVYLTIGHLYGEPVL